MFQSLRSRLALAYVSLIAVMLLLLAVLLVNLSENASMQTQVTLTILGIGLCASLAAIAIALLVARRTSESLAHLSRVAQRLTAGNLQARARAPAPREVRELALSINEMAAHLSETIEALRSDQARLTGVLAHMADGLLIVDEQECVTHINQAGEQILGMQAGYALGKSFTQVARSHEMTECLRATIRRGQEQTRVVEQSGAHRFLRMIATPLQSDGMSPTYLVMLQDLTQIRRLETIRRDFISNLSHELRTPLAALQAMVETLNDGALEDPPAARRFVAQMEDEVHQLTWLVDDLLDLSAIESGRTPIERRPVDLSAIVCRAAERLDSQAARAGIALRVVETEPVMMNADGARIEQVVLNLIHNAIKFTPSGGEIECRVVPHDGHVTVSVRDTGIGISAADLPRIFERFYKADKARAGGGTGLGLAIAKHIVELHGGHIWAESVEGQGTIMLFTLPLG